MEQDVDTGYRVVCSTCLSSDRNLLSINGLPQVYQVFRLLMYDFAGERFGDTIDLEQLICWECIAMMKRFIKFKQQVHSAQEHIRVLAMSRSQESMDHTYMSPSLSCLETVTKLNYDSIYFDYTTTAQDQPTEWPQHYIAINATDDVKDEGFDVTNVQTSINLDIGESLLEVPEIVLTSPVSAIMSDMVVGEAEIMDQTDMFVTHVKGEQLCAELTVSPMTPSKLETVIIKKTVPNDDDKEEANAAYTTEYMTDEEMIASREMAKQKVKYASSSYKCELCIVGFYTQHQVEEHFMSAHKAKPGRQACRICYVYIEASKLEAHISQHYIRRVCKICGHCESSTSSIKYHLHSHAKNNNMHLTGKGRKRKEPPSNPPQPGDLRKLLSKTTIEGYQCLECDMFFKNSRARKNHVDRFHRDGLQCDVCKKRFVNRTTLTTHLKLHEGPLPRGECPICHKMVRLIQLKYHIQRHQNKSKYECVDCNKVFSHLATYQAHLKYSRAHASEQVLKYPCPMCNKGYPTKEAMQDHFNYNHLGKTAHKCPICDKPIASRLNVERHMMRVHSEKKPKPKNHRCQTCGKAFTDRKALTQHIVIHSGARPLCCDICQQTFKQKASLYTHRKRVHKVFPNKRSVQFIEDKPDIS